MLAMLTTYYLSTRKFDASTTVQPGVSSPHTIIPTVCFEVQKFKACQVVCEAAEVLDVNSV